MMQAELDGQNLVFFILSRPICIILFALTILSLGVPIYRRMKKGQTIFDHG